jgi:hypothetical protein
MKTATYDILWEKGIKKRAEEIVDANYGKVVFDYESKDRIFEEYNKLRDYVKTSFMRDENGLLDRHKVCACLILAIIKSQPLIYNNYINNESTICIFNENLALSVGLSLLSTYILCSEEDSNSWFNNKFVYPKAGNTTYQELLALSLCYDVNNNHYSILLLSNILFMIEKYTKLNGTKDNQA